MLELYNFSVKRFLDLFSEISKIHSCLVIDMIHPDGLLLAEGSRSHPPIFGAVSVRFTPKGAAQLLD